MVSRELDLNACVIGGVFLDVHDTGIVDEDVKLFDGAIDLVGCGSHGVEIIERKSYERDFDFGVELLDPGNDGLNPRFGSGGENDMCWVRMC